MPTPRPNRLRQLRNRLREATQGRDLEHWLEAERQLRDEAGRRGGKQTDDAFEAEKRLDGLVEQKPSPASRTPSGEQL